MKLTSEQLSMLENCESAEEVLDKAKAAGYDITPEMAESLASGFVDLDEADLEKLAGGCAGGEKYYEDADFAM